MFNDDDNDDDDNDDYDYSINIKYIQCIPLAVRVNRLAADCLVFNGLGDFLFL